MREIVHGSKMHEDADVGEEKNMGKRPKMRNDADAHKLKCRVDLPDVTSRARHITLITFLDPGVN